MNGENKMVKVKAKFVFDVVVDIEDTRGFDPEEIVMKQVTGQLNLAHHGAFDLTFNTPETLSPTECNLVKENQND